MLSLINCRHKEDELGKPRGPPESGDRPRVTQLAGRKMHSNPEPPDFTSRRVPLLPHFGFPGLLGLGPLTHSVPAQGTCSLSPDALTQPGLAQPLHICSHWSLSSNPRLSQSVPWTGPHTGRDLGSQEGVSMTEEGTSPSGSPQSKVWLLGKPAPAHLRAFAVAVPSAWNAVLEISTQFPPSFPSGLCSDISSSVRPSLTTCFKIATISLALHAPFPCFLGLHGTKKKKKNAFALIPLVWYPSPTWLSAPRQQAFPQCPQQGLIQTFAE